MEPMTPAPATMQSAAMRRSGAIDYRATMQSAAMRRSGAID
ncbi:cobalamin (vitamin b12) biosynthesis cbix protein [Mycobacterium tuberculosis]|nr:cobalamin (vitamin b12) biosynthesis cbix protein [Mycobacterium tuberculosis]CNX00310.1 cobalamin (vitamin b12) biosynthesis cbix protein [Mycobacterium tuberculosis]